MLSKFLACKDCGLRSDQHIFVKLIFHIIYKITSRNYFWGSLKGGQSKKNGTSWDRAVPSSGKALLASI